MINENDSESSEKLKNTNRVRRSKKSKSKSIRWEQRVVQVQRVAKVVKGGKKLSFRATVIVGNQNSQVGVGVAKADEVSSAVKKAINDARKNLIQIPLTKGETKYAITYSFGLDDNSFFIDFHNKNSYKSKDCVPLATIRRFRTLDTNLRRYVIIKLCQNCHKYYYVSETFRMDYKNCCISNLTINEECFRLNCKLPNNKLRLFTVSNSLLKRTTTVEYSQNYDELNIMPPLSPYPYQSFHKNKRGELTFDLIELSDPESFIDRLNNLIAFF